MHLKTEAHRFQVKRIITYLLRTSKYTFCSQEKNFRTKNLFDKLSEELRLSFTSASTLKHLSCKWAFFKFHLWMRRAKIQIEKLCITFCMTLKRWQAKTSLAHRQLHTRMHAHGCRCVASFFCRSFSSSKLWHIFLSFACRCAAFM